MKNLDLGYATIFSVFGQIAINLIFMGILIGVLKGRDFYQCHAFDNSNVDLSHWWELADNFESSATSLLMIFQIFHAAAVFNIGYRYRKGFIFNWRFVSIYILLLICIIYITISDPNPTGCLFRINCGTKEALESIGFGDLKFTPPSEVYSAHGNNVLPIEFRGVILVLALVNLLVLIAWEVLVIQNIARYKWFIERFGQRRNEYRF